MMRKRLYKSTNRKIAGVCGGIAESFGIDPFWVRLVLVLAFLYNGAGLIAYIVASIVMEENPQYKAENSNAYTHVEEARTYTTSDSDVVKGFDPKEYEMNH